MGAGAWTVQCLKREDQFSEAAVFVLSVCVSQHHRVSVCGEVLNNDEEVFFFLC